MSHKNDWRNDTWRDGVWGTLHEPGSLFMTADGVVHGEDVPADSLTLHDVANSLPPDSNLDDVDASHVTDFNWLRHDVVDLSQSVEVPNSRTDSKHSSLSQKKPEDPEMRTKLSPAMQLRKDRTTPDLYLAVIYDAQCVAIEGKGFRVNAPHQAAEMALKAQNWAYGRKLTLPGSNEAVIYAVGATANFASAAGRSPNVAANAAMFDEATQTYLDACLDIGIEQGMQPRKAASRYQPGERRTMQVVDELVNPDGTKEKLDYTPDQWAARDPKASFSQKVPDQRTENYQDRFADEVIRPIVDKMIADGIIPKPISYTIEFPPESFEPRHALEGCSVYVKDDNHKGGWREIGKLKGMESSVIGGTAHVVDPEASKKAIWARVANGTLLGSQALDMVNAIDGIAPQIPADRLPSYPERTRVETEEEYNARMTKQQPHSRTPKECVEQSNTHEVTKSPFYMPGGLEDPNKEK